MNDKELARVKTAAEVICKDTKAVVIAMVTSTGAIVIYNIGDVGERARLYHTIANTRVHEASYLTQLNERGGGE